MEKDVPDEYASSKITSRCPMTEPQQNFEPCTYLKQDETGKQQFDCEERCHSDSNMVIENCFQDQGLCRNRIPKVLRDDEYSESKVDSRPPHLQKKLTLGVIRDVFSLTERRSKQPSKPATRRSMMQSV